MTRAQLTADELSGEPELDVTTLGIDEFFHVEKLGDARLDPTLFTHFSRRRVFECLVLLNAAARADPEVVAPGPVVAYEENSTFVRDNPPAEMRWSMSKA